MSLPTSITPTFILSLAHQDKITNACKPLAKLGLNYIAAYLVFNDGNVCMLSNAFHVAKDYYSKSFYKEDYTFSSNIISRCAESFYLHTEHLTTSERFDEVLKKNYHVYPAYTIVRRNPECNFVFSAMRNSAITAEQNAILYRQTVKAFEVFCIKFIDEMLKVILTHNPDYRYSYLLTEKPLRDKVIKQQMTTFNLTIRQQDCLWYLSLGYPLNVISQKLNLSENTVSKYLSELKERFECRTNLEMIVQAIQLGLIGCFSSSRNEKLVTPRLYCSPAQFYA